MAGSSHVDLKKRGYFAMSKSFHFPNVGTCSKQTNIVLNDDHTIESIEVVGGCTSCPDQIAKNLKKALAEM